MSKTEIPPIAIDLDGGTDIGAAIVDADLFLIDDGAGGTMRKTAASRIKTYAGTTINNNADNRVITGSGTAGTLEGEAGLTFEASSTQGSLGLRDSSGTFLLQVEGNESAASVIFTRVDHPLTLGVNNSEKMRIPTDKGIFVNTTSRTGSTNVLSVLGDSSEDVMHVRTANDSGAVKGIDFTDGDGTNCGEITINAGSNSTAYSTSSDYRLKENVNYTFDATSRLKQLKPSRFNWISKPDTTVDGFLAHEVSSIVPEAINGSKDETKTVTNAVISKRNALLTEGITEAEWEQGKKDNIYPNDSTWSASKVIPKHQSIDQAKLVPLLVKTVQELEARIKALEEA